MAHRSDIQREKDLVAIEQRYMRGESQSSIAEDLTVSQRTVSTDIKLIIKRWRDETNFDLDEMKSRELNKINNLELTYWDAWKLSQEDEEITTAKIRGKKGANDPMQEQIKKAKGQVGDPRFLQGIQWCIEQRVKILGLAAPERSQSLNLIQIVGIDTAEI